MEKVEAYYSRRLNLWIVRLQEVVEGSTKESAESKARRLLGLYREAASFESPYSEKLDKLRESVAIWKKRALDAEANRPIVTGYPQ